MRVCLLFLGAALLSAQANANPSQFDLKCTGIEKLYDGGPSPDRPFTRTFHIDLSRGEYCVDACSSMQRVKSVDSLQIVFADDNNHGGPMSMYVKKEKVDRRNGAYELALLDAKVFKHGTAKGKCEPAPFTPFPTTKF
jgi:hypothetical protein